MKFMRFSTRTNKQDLAIMPIRSHKFLYLVHTSGGPPRPTLIEKAVNRIFIKNYFKNQITLCSTSRSTPKASFTRLLTCLMMDRISSPVALSKFTMKPPCFSEIFAPPWVNPFNFNSSINAPT